MNIPITMIPSEYGNIIATENIGTITRYIVTNKNKMYQIDSSENDTINNVKVLGGADLKWTDTKLAEGFKREIGKSTLYFMDGECVLRKQQLPAKPFKTINVDTQLANDIITMDIETITKDNIITPYLICAYNGSDFITTYSNISLNQKDLFSRFINDLFKFFKNSSKLTIYAHNLSGFDGIFLLKHLIQFGKVEPLLFNGRLISIKVKLNIVGYTNKTIEFKDSYLLLPLSLRKLCKAFKVVSPKGYFPFKLMDIFYNGVLPKLELWTGIDTSIYNELLAKYTNGWNFKDEAIKYCKLDCKCLYDILITFNELIFNEFQINVHKSLTLPALAMRIYKSNFMPKDSIYQILGTVEKAIRESYTGGAVDVYKPHNQVGELFSRTLKKLYYYDVNSLYPTAMALADMPIGKPTSFEGDILKQDTNPFGFFHCKITSPDNMLHPLLQRRIRTSEGLRTIAGLGSWEGWIFSEEMNNAKKYGYQFEILRGYLFERGDLFFQYVTRMYDLRKQYDKSHAMNLIAKLLLNSLYDKFGMKTDITKVEMFDLSTPSGEKEFEELLNIYGEAIHDYVRFDDTVIIVRDSSIELKYDESEDMYHGLDINIAIASAITSYARVTMSHFKNNPDYNLYYSDTDSVVIDKELPEEMVGNNLGQLKLEHTIKKAVFLAPKVYGLIDTNGDKIIKVKGISNSISNDLEFRDLFGLLYKDSSLEFTQEKWFKKVMEGEITISDMAYKLKATSNKRAPIFVNEIYTNTRPYNYDELVK